ncbi:MAG: DUF4349 domain-containing protein [Parcubacteria group bacterium]|jgi:hypothetical protein
MKKTKIIAIVVGVIVLLFFVLVAFMRNISSTSKMGGVAQWDGLDAPMSTGLSSGTTFSNPISGGAQEKNITRDSAPSATYQASENSQSLTDKKVVKNGNLTLKVDKVDAAVSAIEKIAEGNGGSLFSSNFYQNDKSLKSGTLSIKVPVANFEKAFGELKTVASAVVRESTNGQDVTERYQDLEGRIKNKQVEEAAYQKILDQAQKISDVIEVTQALSRVRGEIESFQGQLRYLASQTDMSTITITLSEDSGIAVSDSWRPLQVAKDAIRSLVIKVQNFVDFLIVFVITFLPTLILYLLLFWIVYRIGRFIFVKLFEKKEEEGK